MTEIDLFDKLNPKRDLTQATCDVISQVYKVMQDENNKLEEQNTKWKEDYIALENLKDNQIADLKKKNKWYSEQVCFKECAEVWGQLEQAKVIIATLLKNQPPLENVYDIGKFDIDDYRDIIEQAEQFIKE